MKKFFPNILSISRIVISFFIIEAVLENNLVCAMVLFVFASISDFLDGYLAREFHLQSDLGAILDPLADKTLMTISYALFVYVKFIPLYTAIIVIGRDLMILSAVIVCRISKVNLKIQPLTSSKINTTIQLLFIILVLACRVLSINVPCLVESSAAVVSIFTVFSGAEYVRKYYWIKDKIFKR
ncbi:MAG: CDP-alcohol phosphatidyltransferase family protein [Holosporaceae bacterium]|jgi:cardiolipin synthase|nr:CDP-alcohol phosphatidyltransferase family protein [Holosporaceae bacterium]